MAHLDTTGQLALFPELADSPELPSISTLPEFDKALHNLIKMSDLGAFISVTVHGLDKSYSVHVRELEIPEDFLLDGRGNAVSQQFPLFPEPLRQQLRKLSYDVKGFFNRENAFRTSFGYFLYRPYFRIWSKFGTESGPDLGQNLIHFRGRIRSRFGADPDPEMHSDLNPKCTQKIWHL